jgi:dihydrofolate synthase/folylpolyglutamate synthase
MELLKHGTKTIILDGAHNPQKMSAFITSLKKEFPGQTFCFLISVKKGKNYPAMFKYITPVVDNLIVTQFSSVKQGMQIGSESSEKIKSYFQRNGVKKISVENDPKKAYRTALSETKDVLVVTGSLYLLSEIYKQAKNG